MRAELSGPFRIEDAEGADRTPRGMKERALLALLLLSPGQRRTRAWLQDKLWSDRGPEQAATSLRQALSHVRSALGPLADALHADRTTLWLDPPVATETLGPEALSDIDVRDPEWEEWLRDLRQAVAGTARGAEAAEQVATAWAPSMPIAPTPFAFGGAPPPAAPRPAARPVVLICTRRLEGGDGGRAVARVLSSRVAAALLAAGDVEVIEEEVGPADPLPGPFDAAVEIETWSVAGGAAGGGGGLAPDPPPAGPVAFALLRALGPPRNRCVWTGRSKVPLALADAWEGAEAQALANRAAQAVIDLTALAARASPFAAMSRAVRRIHDFDAPGLAMAEALLRGAAVGEAAPLALAWRGYARLTQALEFRDGGEAVREEARALGAEAVSRAPGHPVVLSLATTAEMMLRGDPELGLHLAARAVREDGSSPYALDALSQARLWQGDREDGYRLALAARLAADGLAHSFVWDMRACLAALRLGRLEEAAEHALTAHRKMPVHRPALRYLLALAILAGRRAEADHYARRLRTLEPDFTPRLLLDPDYPLQTIRHAGLLDALRAALAGGDRR